MRPTIPLGDYRISVYLIATRALQAADGGDAIGCECAWCTNWRSVAATTLPSALQTQLNRLGINPATPSDLYAYDTHESGHLVRLLFYIVGAVQSGPPATIDDTLPDGTQVAGRRYASVADAPTWIGLTVAPPLGGVPRWAPDPTLSHLEVDFRLFVPWTANGSPPPLHGRVLHDAR